jgi:cytochrome c oxidase subunit 3
MSDVKGHHTGGATEALETAKLGIWAFLATEVLLFGGLFTAYTVFRIRYPDLFQTEHLKLNRLFGAINTVILITSSLTMALAIAAARKGKRGLLQVYLSLTILFAAGFLGVKYMEWSEEFAHGLYPDSNIFFSLYFMMTGLHGLHVLGGMAALAVFLVMARKGHITRTYHTPVEIGGLYWHFVDLVWIYLFPLLYLIK